jgi:nucleotide-binding universal stress UspA family protein
LPCRNRGVLIALALGVERAFTVSPMAASNVRVDRILCAVTFSPSSRRVVAWAASLAGPYDGEVRLFHAVPTSDERAAAELDADSERVLRKLFTLNQGLPGRPRISAAVTEGDAAAEILRHARMVEADAIAVGMHARDGSVSPLVARIAINAPCPVLAVDETTPRSPLRSGAFDQVVVAVDFLPASLAAADYACALAHVADAQVTVVHVVPEHWEGPRRYDANVDETRRLVESHFRQLLQATVSDISGGSGNRSDLVTSGRPCVELVRIVTARDAGLIVMGIDAGHKSQEKLGETTSCVMQAARRTVLLVPERLFREPEVGHSDRSSRPY